VVAIAAMPASVSRAAAAGASRTTASNTPTAGRATAGPPGVSPVTTPPQTTRRSNAARMIGRRCGGRIRTSQGVGVLQEDQPAFLRQPVALARQHHIYLELGLGVFLPGSARPPYLKDESVLIGPAGPISWIYEKTHLVPFSEQGRVVVGDGRLPISDTGFGRLAGAICFDQDFPGTMRQAGRAGVGFVFGPSNDWQAIDPAHADAATFRAIENGYSLLRPASNCLSLAVDYRGHVLGAADYFTTLDRQVLITQLPTRGVQTIYSRIGDLFSWLCLAGLAMLLAAARPRRTARDDHCVRRSVRDATGCVAIRQAAPAASRTD
jgi:apolipoprotein N-acyltransferase